MRRSLLAALVTTLVVVVAPTAGAPASAQAPACTGVTVSATVSAESVPGGAWSLTDACVPADAVYETSVLGYSLIGGLGVATYTDGHLGRVAFASVKVAEDRSLTLVGVEDAASGEVRWAYSEGSYTDQDGTRTMSGAAVAATPSDPPTPTEPASVDLAVTGTGTDLATAEGQVPDTLRQLIDDAVATLGAQG